MNMVNAYPALFSFPACGGVCFHILLEFKPTTVKVLANGLPTEGMRMVCRLRDAPVFLSPVMELLEKGSEMPELLRWIMENSFPKLSPVFLMDSACTGLTLGTGWPNKWGLIRFLSYSSSLSMWLLELSSAWQF